MMIDLWSSLRHSVWITVILLANPLRLTYISFVWTKECSEKGLFGAMDKKEKVKELHANSMTFGILSLDRSASQRFLNIERTLCK